MSSPASAHVDGEAVHGGVPVAASIALERWEHERQHRVPVLRHQTHDVFVVPQEQRPLRHLCRARIHQSRLFSHTETHSTISTKTACSSLLGALGTAIIVFGVTSKINHTDD